MSISATAPPTQPTFDPVRFEAEISRYPLDVFTIMPLRRPGDSKKTAQGVRSLSKSPLDAGWPRKRYNSAKVVKRCIREARNAGVRLTAKQAVLDCDYRAGAEQSYLELFAAAGIDEHSVPCVLTGNGKHFYFANPDAVPLLGSLDDYPGIDVCSVGKQCVAAGSLHVGTGKTYRWSEDHAAIEDGLPPLPRQFLKIAKRLASSAPSDSGGGAQYSASEIAAALERLDVQDFRQHDTWLALAMAVHAATDAAAEDAFVAWSIGDERYAADSEIIRKRWRSLRPGKGITARSLDYFLRQAGAADVIPYRGADDIPDDEFVGLDADASLAEHGADFDFDSDDDEDEFDFDFDEPAKSKGMQYNPNKLPEMLSFAEQEMLDGGAPLYMAIDRLVMPVRTEADCDEELIRRKAGSLTLREVSEKRLQHFMIALAKFYKIKDDKKLAYPAPLNLAQHYLAAPDIWQLPALNGIIETPTLRADGTLVQDEGWDQQSKLLLDFGGVEFPRVSDGPTRADALKAMKVLQKPFEGFPFVVDEGGKSASRAVILSAVLTGLVRRSLPSAPMHAVTAPTAGTGKSLACDVVSMIVAGRPAAAMSQGPNEEEDEKRLLASLVRGDQVLMMDNVRRPIHGDALCSILTQSTYKGRPLGKTLLVEAKTNILILASGNSLTFSGDMNRRALLSVMDAQVERPEERRFKIDLRTEIPKRRVELVVAGLTILRAFVAAGRPGLDKVKPYGSFEGWSNIVRGALVWLGEADPCITTDWIREDDPIKESLEQLLLSIYAVHGRRWFGAGELLDEAEQAADNEHARLDAAINAALDGAKINKAALAAYLKANTGRIVMHMRLERKRDSATNSWRYRVSKLE